METYIILAAIIISTWIIIKKLPNKLYTFAIQDQSNNTWYTWTIVATAKDEQAAKKKAKSILEGMPGYQELGKPVLRRLDDHSGEGATRFHFGYGFGSKIENCFAKNFISN